MGNTFWNIVPCLTQFCVQPQEDVTACAGVARTKPAAARCGPARALREVDSRLEQQLPLLRQALMPLQQTPPDEFRQASRRPCASVSGACHRRARVCPVYHKFQIFQISCLKLGTCIFNLAYSVFTDQVSRIQANALDLELSHGLTRPSKLVSTQRLAMLLPGVTYPSALCARLTVHGTRAMQAR